MKDPIFYTPFFNSAVFFKEETVSTMEDARELIKRGYGHGSAVIASYQTGGRGRIPGRKWVSNKKENLLFTLIVDTKSVQGPITSLPLKAGLALAVVFDKKYNLPGRIKWPNDVLVDGKKISGILCEASGGFVLIGIGVNCNQNEFPQGLLTPPTSLYLESGNSIDTLSLFKDIAEELYTILQMKNWTSPIENYLYLKGEKVLFNEGHPDSPEKVEGILQGIGPDGELIIKDKNNNTSRRLFSGELVL